MYSWWFKLLEKLQDTAKSQVTNTHYCVLTSGSVCHRFAFAERFKLYSTSAHCEISWFAPAYSRHRVLEISIVCPLSSITELKGTLLVVPKTKHLRNTTATSLSRNHDPVSQDDPQTLLRAEFHVGTIVFGSSCIMSADQSKRASTRGGDVGLVSQPLVHDSFCTLIHKENSSYMKPLTTTSVDYLEWVMISGNGLRCWVSQIHIFLLSLCVCGSLSASSTASWVQFCSIILARRQTSLRTIFPQNPANHTEIV